MPSCAKITHTPAVAHRTGRLLHYFAPAAAEAGAVVGAGKTAQHWCGWHYDNGSLTGLTSAMYLDAAGQPAACPDPQAGLHIRDRSGGWVGGRAGGRASGAASAVGFAVATWALHIAAALPIFLALAV